MTGGGTLITLAPRSTELPMLVRLALDAERIGASRIHLADDQVGLSEAIAVLRQQTALLISVTATAERPGQTDLTLDPAGDLRTSTGRSVAIDLPADPTLPALELIADLSARIGAAQLPVSICCHEPVAVPALLTALAAGAHTRVGTAGAPASMGLREDVTLVARAAGIGRLIGRPPLSVGEARALLGIG